MEANLSELMKQRTLSFHPDKDVILLLFFLAAEVDAVDCRRYSSDTLHHPHSSTSCHEIRRLWVDGVMTH